MDAKFYTINTTDGPILGSDYTYRGIDYTQKEISVDSLLELSAVLADIGLADVLDLSDAPTIKLREVLMQILKHKSHDRILRILLTQKDGKPITEGTFMKGRAVQLWGFASEVVADFFTINAELSSSITDTLLRAFARTLRLVRENLPQLTSYISSAEETSPGSKPQKSKRTRK